MTAERRLVLDANILIRAVLGKRVLSLLTKYEDSASFFTPDVCFADARRHLDTIFKRRGMPVDSAIEILDQVALLVGSIAASFYQDFEAPAMRRIRRRDPTDWVVVAASLFLDCPIWTEDKDFFGSGIATWTTDRVEVYLEEPPEPERSAEALP